MEPGFGRLKRGPRQGTSISEFLSRFSDSSACLDHVFERNHPNPGPCPKCGRTVRWFRIRSTNRYSSNCCGGSAIHPLPGTVFGNSNLPLGMWFYAILHFCNTSTGLTTENLAIHLGISHKAAYRMGVRIRMHLAALDRERKLGGPGARVYLQEDELVNIRSDDTGRCGRLRVVALSDSADFAVIPIRKGKFHNSLPSIRRCLHPESLLEFREEETLRKMTHHRRSKWVESGAWRVTDNLTSSHMVLPPLCSGLSRPSSCAIISGRAAGRSTTTSPISRSFSAGGTGARQCSGTRYPGFPASSRTRSGNSVETQVQQHKRVRV